MKVLHIIDSLVTGGAEKLIVDTIPLFNLQGIKTDVALLNATKYPFYSLLKKDECCVIYELSYGSLYNPLLVFKIIPLLRKYDIVHVHLFPAQYWVILAKILSLSTTKLVFTEHSTNNRRLSNIIFKQIDKIVYKFYDKIICISDDVKNVLMKKLKINSIKLQVILNGINLKYYREEVGYNRTEYGFDKDDIIIIMVAAFRREKNHSDLLYALSKLDKKYKLVLVGDGDQRKTIESLIKKLNIENRVLLTGITTNVPKFVKMGNIGVLSSHWEGFGLSAIEIMACEIPIIVSEVTGISKVVGSSALYFKNGNVEELVRKIIMLNNTQIYNEYVIRGKINATKYDIMDTVIDTINLYKNLTDGNSKCN